jgi:hypothetical protein
LLEHLGGVDARLVELARIVTSRSHRSLAGLAGELREHLERALVEARSLAHWAADVSELHGGEARGGSVNLMQVALEVTARLRLETTGRCAIEVVRSPVPLAQGESAVIARAVAYLLEAALASMPAEVVCGCSIQLSAAFDEASVSLCIDETGARPDAPSPAPPRSDSLVLAARLIALGEGGDVTLARRAGSARTCLTLPREQTPRANPSAHSG